eukprot:1190965-Prorocentrum_minimum.AAC.7
MSSLADKLYGSLQQNPRVALLGPPQVPGAPRMPLASFLIRAPGSPGGGGAEGEGAGRFLHYNFVATVLNDLFGVQVRRLSI